MTQREKHPLAGKTVILKISGPDPVGFNGSSFRVEDWWINVAGKSWMFCDGNPTCLGYAVRSAVARLPIDDDVLYGKVGGLGHIFHESELGEVVEG
jgi:hypothetical protein